MTKKLLVSVLKNMFWALLFAVILWVLVDRNIRKSVGGEPVEVQVHAPEGITVTYLETGSRPPPVTATISAPRSALERRPTGRPIRATYRFRAEDIDGARDLDTEISIPLDRFDLDIPQGIDIVPGTFEPWAVRVILSRVNQRPVPVEPDIRNIPAGFEVESWRLEPTRVRAEGPREAISRPRARLRTEPIDIGQELSLLPGWSPTTDATEELALTPRVVESDDGIRPLTETVRLQVRVRPEMVEVTFDEVKPALTIEPPGTDFQLHPIPARDYISVTLRGPAAIMQDAEALRRSLRVIAVCDEELARSIRAEGLKTLAVEVYAPPGVEVVDHDRRMDVEVKVPRQPTLDDGG